jgi:hypothetical protein
MSVNVIQVSRESRAALGTLPFAGVAAMTVLALAACGPSSGAESSGAPAGGSTPAPTGTTGGGAAGLRQPGVNGLIAAVNGSTMQVQTRTDQTAVTWNDSTTFTTTASATFADVRVGSCVTVLEPASSGSATPSGGSGSAPATQVTAASVEVRPAVNGECTGGFGGFGGAPGGASGGAPGAVATPPSSAPTGTATGGPGGRAGGDFGRRAVAGLVSAVNGDTITVLETMRARGPGSATATATPPPPTVTVTTIGSTTYTAQKAAAASDIAVGECASALGKADDTGAVTATSISLRPATNGSCTSGFGGTGGGRGGATGTATTGGPNG